MQVYLQGGTFTGRTGEAVWQPIQQHPNGGFWLVSVEVPGPVLRTDVLYGCKPAVPMRTMRGLQVFIVPEEH